MKTPSKDQLREHIAALQSENNKLLQRQAAAQMQEWNSNLPRATDEFHKQVAAIFPNLVTNARYEHVDASGYWFSFELSNDTRRQTFAVRHGDISGHEPHRKEV